MSSSLLCGLGNPGRSYANTRHNLGYKVLESLSTSLKAETCPGGAEYLSARASYMDSRVYLVKPLTYVNESGIAVSDAVARFGIKLQDILVICDDCELPFGRIRLRSRGSHGGHRGLESIIYHLQSEEFPRLRIGIDKPASMDLADYVLSEFEPEEEKQLASVLEDAERAALHFLESGVDRAMSLVNRRVEVD